MEELVGVSETLLISLYARYLETKRTGGIINDQMAVEVYEKLGANCSRFSNMWVTQLATCIRTEILEQQTKHFLVNNADSVVVNLGAGLSTMFFLVDDGKVEWFELDLPAVRPIWDAVFGETERHKFIAYSALDFAWIDHLRNLGQGRFLFIAEGLSMYLEEEEIRKLIVALKKNFPGSEIFIEAISPFMARHTELHPTVSKTSATFKWGVKSLKELESWEDGIHMIEEWFYLDRYPSRWGWIRFARFFPGVRESAKVGRLKLG